MLRGMKVLVTALLSIIFLKKKLYRHHWTSVAIIFIGLVLVGIAVLTGNSN
jgi:drug/metabolite transporter (DMT)-like permease